MVCMPRKSNVQLRFSFHPSLVQHYTQLTSIPTFNLVKNIIPTMGLLKYLRELLRVRTQPFPPPPTSKSPALVKTHSQPYPKIRATDIPQWRCLNLECRAWLTAAFIKYTNLSYGERRLRRIGSTGLGRIFI